MISDWPTFPWYRVSLFLSCFFVRNLIHNQENAASLFPFPFLHQKYLYCWPEFTNYWASIALIQWPLQPSTIIGPKVTGTSISTGHDTASNCHIWHKAFEGGSVSISGWCEPPAGVMRMRGLLQWTWRSNHLHYGYTGFSACTLFYLPTR